MRDIVKVIIAIGFLLGAYLSQSPYNPFFASQTSTTVSLYAVEDAKVLSLYPSNNYGITSVTTVGRPYETGVGLIYHYLWMKFDLSTIPTYASISDVYIQVYCEYVGKTGFYELTRGTADTWTETAITWNNQPAIDVGAYDSWNVLSAGSFRFYYGGASKIVDALKSDKKISFVLVPDRDHPSEETWSNWRCREYGGGFQPTMLVTYTIPTYTLTVNFRDQNNNPIDGKVSVIKDTTEVVSDASTTGGTWYGTLEYGQYKIKGFYETQTKETTVTLDTSKTVTLSFTALVQYTLTVVVKDQLNNPLIALVYFDTTPKTADATGKAMYTIAGPVSVSVTASINVGEQTFETSKTILVDRSKTETITITRRFWFRFFINYTDGSLASGTLSLSNKESLSVSISNGYGEAYLLDGRYKLTFSASPTIDLGTIDVTADKDVYATISKETLESTTTTETTTTTTVTTPPTVPFYLIPGPYIYILIGVLVILGVVALIVRRKTK